MFDKGARAVEAAYAEYLGTLTRRLTALTRDASVAEDLAHEAFARLVVEIDAGRTPDDVGAWLNRVATNLAMSRGRHLSVVDRRAVGLPRPAEPRGPEAEILDRELNAALSVAVGTLAADDRRAVILAAQGYPGPEIAALIGRSPGATRTLLCRARARLRGRLLRAGFAPA